MNSKKANDLYGNSMSKKLIVYSVGMVFILDIRQQQNIYIRNMCCRPDGKTFFI